MNVQDLMLAAYLAGASDASDGVKCKRSTFDTWLAAQSPVIEETSDGYHTFKELYDHRITLFLALARRVTEDVLVWRSKYHSDGSSFAGWFVVGIGTEPGEQITYHLPMARWEETSWMSTLDNAPDFDGHTSADVLERLQGFYR